jgi:hypothetical protein
MKRSFQIAVGISRFLRRMFVLLTLLCPAIVWASTYTFEGLNIGTLVPENNWMVGPSGAGDHIFC